MRFVDITRYDPLPAFRFIVQVGPVIMGSFTEVTGLEIETQAIEYREGGDAPMMRTQPGISKSNPITLRRGLTQDPSLFLWHSQIYSFGGIGVIAPDPYYRRDVSIIVQDRGGIPMLTYQVFRAWPSKFKVGDFKSTSNELAMEEVVLNNEGFSLSAPGLTAIVPVSPGVTP